MKKEKEKVAALQEINRKLRAEIAAHRQADEVIKESKKRLQQILDFNPSLIYTTNLEDYACTSVSQRLISITGYQPEEMIRDPNFWSSHLHPDDRALVIHEVQQQLETGSGSLEYRFQHKDRSYRWIHDSFQVVTNDNGRPIEVVGSWMDITEAHKLSEKLSYQASHDNLTGLINRRVFEQRLHRALQSARVDKTEHALCFLDLDQFKVINDTCGHVAGDELLRQLARILKGNVRKRDTLARLGGDEFGVLMERCSLKEAERVTESLLKAVQEFRFAWGEERFSLGVSIGVVCINDTSENLTSVMKNADEACYGAKEAGRNRVYVYYEDDAELATRRQEMLTVSKIQRALKENHFLLYYQTIVPVDSHVDEGDHFELLLRMVNEEGQVLPPAAFLPAAERYNLSIKIDRWVISTAFQWFCNQPEFLERLRLCSINLSGHSLGDVEFLKFISEQFEETNIPPEKICFEITETAAIANLTVATHFIEELKKLGCRFSLDDFGTGLSSFAYLKNLPVDYLKIDGTFVKNLVDDTVDFAMVKSINEIGHILEKQTIAEFVETDVILAKLRSIGVDFAQGYAISKPRPL